MSLSLYIDRRSVLIARRGFHEAVKQGGVGGEIAAIVAEEGLDYLDAPIVRIGAPFTPIPFARPLEQAYRVTSDKIYKAIKQIF